MSPGDLIVWALSAGASILILTIPVAVITAAVTFSRGKL